MNLIHRWRGPPSPAGKAFLLLPPKRYTRMMNGFADSRGRLSLQKFLLQDGASRTSAPTDGRNV